MRLSVLLVALFLILPSVASADGGFAVDYRGEIIDEAGTPISGVFALTFKLYEEEEGQSAYWQEEHHVSVYEGLYDVVLGDLTPVPAERNGQTAHIAVEVFEIGEFTRHDILLGPSIVQSREEVLAELDVVFADLADRSLFAVEADEADDCVRIGGRTLEELDRYEELLGQISELRAQVDDMTGAALGSRTTTLERVGGAGGNSYSRTCPPGHVLTGIRGGAGALIDSVELICSPLQ
ncbi:MAG: hypothetical protein ACJAYU_004029 [Bradymonadia bacterium]|jgi:hypothetical protein